MLKAVRWQRLDSRQSENGCSINFWLYPLQKQETYASTSACGPPCTDTTRFLGPMVSMLRPNTLTSWLTLLLKRLRKATQTRWNWLLSQHWKKTQLWSPRSWYSIPQYPWVLTQLKALLKIWGYMPFNMMD